jgi:hypothetical protein
MNSQMTKLIHAGKQTATAFLIPGLFRDADLALDISPNPYHLNLKEENLWQN